MVQFRVFIFISSLSSNFTLPEFTYQIHPGVSRSVTFNLIPNRIGFCHGQISIETATHSYNELTTILVITVQTLSPCLCTN